MTTTQTIEIETLLPWSAPKRVMTKAGERILRKSEPNEKFHEAWRGTKDALRAAGVSWSKDERTGEWQVCWWAPIPAAEQAQRTAAVEASKATSADVDIPRPDGLEYLPFQRAGVNFANGKKAVLIADEMGLGKTIQAIGVINSDTSIHRVLIVCPATLKINWKRECEKWLARKQTVGIARGEYFPSTDIVIINYDILAKFQRRETFFWDLIICDECHLVKNPKAQAHRL